MLAGSPSPAPPPTQPLPGPEPFPEPVPPVGTEAGPPVVTICTVEFCCVYEGTAYVCNKTGFTDWLGDKVCNLEHPNEKTNRECRDQAQRQFDRTSDECDKLAGPAYTECHKQALKQLVEDLRECNRQYPLYL